MIFPTGDGLTPNKHSFGVLLLIGLMIVSYLPKYLEPSFEGWSARNLGFVPMSFSEYPLRQIHALVSSTFLHADIFHLLGNCLFLWVFGRSLEQLFGLRVFLATFPVLGVVGLLAHWALLPNSPSPVIGASGAIATLMGAYLVLFPEARMKILIFVGVFFKRFETPAWLFLFYWVGLQFLSLVIGSSELDNVAYAVHVGGFAAGLTAGMAWKVLYPFAEEHLSTFLRDQSVAQFDPQP